MGNELREKVVVVAGGTRGASRAIAVEMGRAGATVYVTGRSSRAGRSEVDRPETIEQTAALVEEAGGRGIAVRVDHLQPAEVATFARRVEAEQGGIDVLVDGVWGGDRYIGWGVPVWEHPLEASLRMLHLAIDAHVITSHHLLPLVLRRRGLVVEMTDGTAEYNATYRKGTTLAFYVAKAASHLLVKAQGAELREHGVTAVAVTPGWLRSENMLEVFGVREENWRDALAAEPHFAISESPTFVGRAVAALAADPGHGRFSGRTLSSGELAQLYEIDDVDGSRPDAWRYMVEVTDAGRPADTTGYR